jgi:FMN phosphatase YigB (HAD superfamily)
VAREYPLVILLDIDNTLLDNDELKADLDRHLAASFGDPLRGLFWDLYEEVRRDLDVVSFPVVLERLQQEAPDAHAFRRLTDYLMRYPFRKRLYPGAATALRHLARLGALVVLSDGDPWYQAKKITDSGIARRAGGNVLIFAHKEEHLEDVRRWYPARHYAFFDDKPWLVAGIKQRLGDAVTGVWVRQGSYARPGWGVLQPAPDLVLEEIAQARWLTEAQLTGRAPGPATPPPRKRVSSAMG